MSTLSELPVSESEHRLPLAKPLDEARWQGWIAKGHRLDARRARTRLETVKMVSLLGLLAAAGFWPYVESYEVMFRFAVAMAAIFVMFHAIQSGHYVLAILFGAIALLYNPVVQLFPASDDLKRVLLTISATPFIVSLGWRDRRRTP